MSEKKQEVAMVEPEVMMGDEAIKSRIFTIRGVQVMLSNDLATLYDVEVKYLHRQVKRNEKRFPSDFVMHLSPEEANVLRCQNVTSKRGGDRYGVLAFTEQGVAMLSSVLKSDRAAEVNVAIMRAFVAMRKALASMAPMVATQQKYVPSEVAIAKFNKQNPALTAKATSHFHDRFIILDGKELYHFGSSLNQLGRHYCAVVKMDPGFIPSILSNI